MNSGWQYTRWGLGTLKINIKPSLNLSDFMHTRLLNKKWIFLLAAVGLAFSFGSQAQNPESASASDELARKAEVFLAKNDYEQALRHAQQVLDSNETGLATADSLSLIARIYKARGSFHQAGEHYKRAIDLYRQHGETGNPGLMAAIDDLMRIYMHIGEYENALPLYEEEPKRRKIMLGVAHSATAASMEILADIYLQLEHPNQAEALLLEVLKNQSSGSDPVQSAGNLLSLGDVYMKSGNYGEALSRYEQALAEIEKATPKTNPRVNQILNEPGNLYFKLSLLSGEDTKNDFYYQQAIKTAKKSADPHDIFYVLYRHASRPPFEREAQKALEELLLGADVSVPAEILEVGILTSKDEQAQRYFEIATRELDKPANVNNYQVVGLLQAVGQTYLFSKKDYRKAKTYYERALKITEDALGSEHYKNAMILEKVALSNQHLGNHAQAIPHLERALKIADANPQRVDTFIKMLVLSYLVSSYQELGESSKAQTIVEQAGIICDQSSDSRYMCKNLGLPLDLIPKVTEL